MSSKRFEGVTSSVWDCVKAKSIQENKAVYEPADGAEGTVTIPTPVGTLVLEFPLDAAASTVTYTVQSKPLLVPESAMWSGIQDSIEACIKSCGDS